MKNVIRLLMAVTLLAPALGQAATKKKPLEFRIKYFDLSDQGPSLSTSDKADLKALEEAMVKNKCFEKQVRAFREAKQDETIQSLASKAKGLGLRVQLDVTFGPEKNEKEIPVPKMAELFVWKTIPEQGEVLLNSDHWAGDFNSCRVATTRVRRVLSPVVDAELKLKAQIEEEKRQSRAREHKANLKKAGDLLKSF